MTPWPFPTSSLLGNDFQDIATIWNLFNFNITTSSAGDPILESRIVSSVSSYGQQLGRLSDAMNLVIEGLAKSHPGLNLNDKPEITAFLDLYAKIEDEKSRSTTVTKDRCHRLLEQLRKNDRPGYEDLMRAQKRIP